MLQLLRRFKSFRVNVVWYFFVILFPLLVYLLSLWSTQLFGFDIGGSGYHDGFKMAVPYILLALPFGPLMEELGWRGYMLPRLLKKYNIYLSSLILGITWAFWHIASFTFPGAAIPSVFEVNVFTIGLYVLSITAQTFIFTFVYLRTNGSLVIAILLHAAFNAASNVILSIYPEVTENVDFRLHLYCIHIALLSLISMILFRLLYLYRGRVRGKFKK